MADCHIGGWREPQLKELGIKAFFRAVDVSLTKNVDFILISGDLFNTALPDIDSLRNVVKKLKEVKDKGVNVYIIPGSHDFSPSGKTMIDVLEKAGLVINVVKGKMVNDKLRLDFTEDRITNAKITGMVGRRNMLEKTDYGILDYKYLENEPGFKIFMFHTALDEFKPEELSKMDSSSISILPKGFNYYAGGHVHFVMKEKQEKYGTVVFPGPVFPNNFRELERLKHGGFYIWDEGRLEYIDLKMKNVIALTLNAENKSSEKVEMEINELTEKENIKDSIVLIRVEGKLDSGKPYDINFKEIFNNLEKKRAYFVMKNTSKLTSKEFEEIKVKEGSVEEIENTLIDKSGEQVNTGNMAKKIKDLLSSPNTVKTLMHLLSSPIKEGEKKYAYEERIKKETDELFGLKN